VKEEIRRVMAREVGKGETSGVLPAMEAFIDTMEAWYEEDRKRD
jgi:hypothetical protein